MICLTCKRKLFEFATFRDELVDKKARLDQLVVMEADSAHKFSFIQEQEVSIKIPETFPPATLDSNNVRIIGSY